MAYLDLPTPLLDDELVDIGLWSLQLADLGVDDPVREGMNSVYDHRARACEFLIRSGLEVEIAAPRSFRVRLELDDPRALDVHYTGTWVYRFGERARRRGSLPPVRLSASGFAAYVRDLLDQGA